MSENKKSVVRIMREMPCLNHLEMNFRGSREVGRMLGVHAQPSGRAGQIVDGYVRLVGKAIWEYKDTRIHLVRFLEQGVLDDLHRAQDCFESCVQALHRALNYLYRLRRFGYQRADGAPLVPRLRELEILGATVRKSIRDMRGALEHLDEHILDGVLPEDSPVGPWLQWDVATLGNHRLRYADIARWIQQLHEFAMPLCEIQLRVGAPLDVQ